MVPAGMKIKAYTRQEEESRKRIAQLAKYGHSMEEIYERLPKEPLGMPDLDDLHFGAGDSDDEGLSDDDLDEDGDLSENDKGNLGDDVVEEFRRERMKDDEAR